MTFLQVYAMGAGVVLAIMTVLWMVSVMLKNASIVDIFWGTGFVACSWLYFALAPGGVSSRKWVICVLVTVWGLRLSLYILWRNWGKGEDFRYRKWREENPGTWWWKSYYRVFLLQGLLMWIISAPLLAAQIGGISAGLIWPDYVAIVVWGIGFFLEVVGDLQLARFKAAPGNKRKVFDRGLWRYTRHPNYFGEATQWWGYYLLGLVGGGWWTVFSPILMTILLLRVSGVALLERTLKETKPGYEEYVRSTSAFVPWFPRE